MRKIIIITSLLITSCFIWSCSDKPTGTGYSIGFVSEYVIPERISLEQYSSERIKVRIDGKGFRSPNKNGTSTSSPYMELAEKYGDTKYRSHVLPHSNPSLSQEVQGIIVICDRDIDFDHPAGTPVDDIVLMLGWNYSEYINSGYKNYTKELSDAYGYSISGRNGIGHTPFFKYLSDIKKSDLVLMCTDFFLFPPRDWAAGDYNLTVTIYGENFELSGDVTYTVE